ncbi:MAG TPA: hypothetical protein VM618_08075 [Acidimicrobiia bacterium]|nr:hypothetical protein [Acidimicrobiia bacterium]
MAISAPCASDTSPALSASASAGISAAAVIVSISARTCPGVFPMSLATRAIPRIPSHSANRDATDACTA